MTTDPALRLLAMLASFPVLPLTSQSKAREQARFGGVDQVIEFMLGHIGQTPAGLGHVDAVHPGEAAAQHGSAPDQVQKALPGPGVRGVLDLRAEMAGRIIRAVLARIADAASSGAGLAHLGAVAAILIAPCKQVFAEGA
ncbi:hypothetical protein ABWI01_03380 [Oceanicaulis alexandrii]|uniref:hypothetical protein n=1 Tax=Oceanicaulis alexandrii TaxID=153233 RepID=UPI0035D10D5C